LSEGGPATAGRYAVNAVLLLGIGAGLAAAMLATLPDLDPGGRRAVDAVAIAVAALFAVEYAGRLWAAGAAVATAPGAARRRYALSGLGVIDAVAVVMLVVARAAPLPQAAVDLLGLAVLLKLVRYAPALAIVAAVVRNERRPLAAALLVMAVLLVFASAIMYELERAAQPGVFSSIPKTLWWGIVTIATVGYGDMTPMTPWGRLVGGAVMVLGIAMFAVPAGILATGFAAELRRRNFVVTWNTVAKVPLFAGLDAGRIAEIAQLLKPRVVPAASVLVRRGDPADAMYFIMAGQVEVEVQPQPVRLGKGQYFGEVGLLRDTVRNATVTTVGECQLLVLDRSYPPICG
jgi:voltage-gated potassium channel